MILLLLPFAAAEQIPDYDRPYSPIFTDKPAYSWTEKVKITIIAPSWNTDRHLIDKIGDDPEHSVKVSTRGFSLNDYKLAETGTNNGIFTGEVTLTGFPHDVDGDGRDDTNPRTGGTGPTNGLLETRHDSALTISFEFADGVVVTESVPISWNVGLVQFLADSYTVGESAVIRVVDPDMNLNPQSIDKFWIDVYSDSDMTGLNVDVIETGPDSGMFEANVLFATGGESSGSRLHAIPGDTVYANYEDRTLPNPYGTSDELDITVQAELISDTLSTQRIHLGNVSFSDGLGNSVSELISNQQVQIVGRLTNNEQHEQAFVHLVQVRNSDGYVIKLSWMSGTLQPGESLDVSQSWTPPAPGDYAVESFVWKSIPSMIPVSEQRVAHVSVG